MPWTWRIFWGYVVLARNTGAQADVQQPPHELTGTGVDYLFMLLDCIAAVSHTSKSNNSQDATIPVDSYLWTKAVQFLKTFDAVAVRYAGTSWRSLVEIVDRSAVRQRNVWFRLELVLVGTMLTLS